MARELALNSTGRVTIWNSTAPAKNMMPIFIRPVAPKNIPARIRGKPSVEPKLATGRIACRKLSGT